MRRPLLPAPADHNEDRSCKAEGSRQVFVYTNLDWTNERGEIDLSDLSRFPDHSTPTARLAPKDTAKFLCAYMVAHINLLNARDFSCSSPVGALLLRHIAPDFTAQVDNIGKSMSWDEVHALWAYVAKVSPGFNFTFHDVCAEIDSSKNLASVYMMHEVHEWLDMPNTTVKALVQASWRLHRSGDWVCYRINSWRVGSMEHTFPGSQLY